MALSRRELLLGTVGTVGIAAAGCAANEPPENASSPSGPLPTNEAVAETEAETTTASTQPTQVPATDAPPTESTEAQAGLVESPSYDGAFPFGLGVASGDPDASSVVLWTRLVDTPQARSDLAVAVDIALDEDFADLVSSTVASAPLGHDNSVHEIAEGLISNTWYHFRFRIGEHTSPTGRTRTLPAAGSDAPPLRFGFSSCQNWESGAYGAHRYLATEDLDLFVWLGDYIYEYGPGNSGDVSSAGDRVHDSPEVTTLDGYRQRYALYKSDPLLQQHHGARPWVVTWDDHEVDNNHAAHATEDGQDADEFMARRAAAYQAWWENMPVRVAPPVSGDDFVIYRSIEWGDLVHLHMLDGRQFRSPQPTDGEPVALPGLGNLGVRLLSANARSPEQSMLGTTQRQWLQTQVEASDAVWNVLGNQVYMHGLNAFPGEVPAINTDTWDGYFGERQRLLEAIGGPDANLVILSGDFHSSTAADVRADPFDLGTPIMATEFMAPAISSTFPEALRGLAPLVLAVNPQVRNFSPENGYMTCEVTADSWTTRLHNLDDVTNEDSPATITATFTVSSGTAGIGSIS